jgi:hypothetical protein
MKTGGSMFGEDPLSDVQKKALSDRVALLENYVKKYRISPDEVDYDTAQEEGNRIPSKVFSRVPDWVEIYDGAVSRLGFWIQPGFLDYADSYYFAAVPFIGGEEGASDPFQEVRFDCIACEGSGVKDEIDCGPCFAQGELVYDLYWDELGEVEAERVEY